jgi:hypothetical protein
MTPIEWVVVVAGIAAIAWVNWYFFLAERRAAPAREAHGVGGRPGSGRGGRNDANDTIGHGQ